MNTQTPTSHPSGCGCGDCSTGKRNRFFRGKMMKAGEFQLEQEYGIERRRRLTRAIAGWGVVHGLGLDGPRQAAGNAPPPTAGELKVLGGLAIDRHGREVIVSERVAVGAANTFVVGGDSGGCAVLPVDGIEPGRYVLAVHYAECGAGEATLPDDCECSTPQKNYTCESVLFSLTKSENCPCGEQPCGLDCGCERDGCSDGAPRSVHACQCGWSAGAGIPAASKLCRWGCCEVDPQDGIDLACVWIEGASKECSKALEGWIIDDCTPRRFIKTNDLLYDLIRGCDLTRIESLSWGAWHRRKDPVPWKEFIEMIHGDPVDEDSMATHLSVTFTGPVMAKTVTPDCFDFTFNVTAEDTGWYDTRSVRIPRVLIADAVSPDPPDTTRTVTLCVDPGWFQEITSRANKLNREGAIVEIEVFGDYILDCHGEAVDANARGFALRDTGEPVRPSGNGTPGGTLLSVFRVDPRQGGAKF